MDKLSVFCLSQQLSNSDSLQQILQQTGRRIELVTSASFLRRSPQYNSDASANIFVLDEPQLEDQYIDRALASHTLHCHDAVNLCLLNSLRMPSNEKLFNVFHDFLIWPCNAEEITARLHRFANGNTAPANSNLDWRLLAQFKQLHLVGNSQRFQHTLRLIEKYAHNTAPVLVQGETGTGKENAAWAIHQLSARHKEAFVPINCGALPDELLESELFGHERGAFTDAKVSQQGLVATANGGTLFLDEVDCLSSKAQAALLRFLQTQEYRPVGGKLIRKSDARILAASNANLNKLVADGLFREDLLYRLNVLLLTMPPLRQRAEDIPPIVECLLKKFAEQYGVPAKPVSQSTLIWLMHQPWPGNVRELENILLRQFLLSDQAVLTIGQKSEAKVGAGQHDEDKNPESGHIDTSLKFQQAKLETIHNFEQHYLHKLLRLTEGNVSAAARISGKERRALGKMLKKYKIDKNDFLAATEHG